MLARFFKTSPFLPQTQCALITLLTLVMTIPEVKTVIYSTQVEEVKSLNSTKISRYTLRSFVFTQFHAKQSDKFNAWLFFW